MIVPVTTRLHFVFLACVAALTIALLSGCGNDCEDCGWIIPDPPDLVGEGWTAFEAGDLDTAALQFEAAIVREPSNAEAHNGLAWTCLRRGNLSDAIIGFDVALANGFPGADAYAGKAILLRDLPPADYQGAIDAALAALGIEAAFVFAHDTRLDWKDLRLVMAQSHFALGEYDAANAEVGLLGGTMQDPASLTFVLDLLSELDRLGSVIGN